ncbi:hypothetical protein GOODEAATRI_013921, partial [Goodea atripinnis]
APASIKGAPGAPMSVKAYDVNSDYVLVAWKPPNTVNEAPITGYFVDRVGHSYYFRVRAVNSTGISRPSRKSDKVTAIDAAESERLQGTDEDVSAYCTVYLVMVLHVFLVCQYRTPSCEMLDCFWGLFAQAAPGILPYVANLGLYYTGAQGLLLHCNDQCFFAVLQSCPHYC